MSTKRLYNYEIMFLIGQSQTSDIHGIIDHIKDIVATRGHGTILAMRKFDERRLAYEIRGQKRGLYILMYARCSGSDMAHIERDCNLSEKILRTLFLRADHLTMDEMLAADGRKDLDTEIRLRASQMSTAAQGQPAEAAPAGAPAAAGAPGEPAAG